MNFIEAQFNVFCFKFNSLVICGESSIIGMATHAIKHDKRIVVEATTIIKHLIQSVISDDKRSTIRRN